MKLKILSQDTEKIIVEIPNEFIIKNHKPKFISFDTDDIEVEY